MIKVVVVVVVVVVVLTNTFERSKKERSERKVYKQKMFSIPQNMGAGQVKTQLRPKNFGINPFLGFWWTVSIWPWRSDPREKFIKQKMLSTPQNMGAGQVKTQFCPKPFLDVSRTLPIWLWRSDMREKFINKKNSQYPQNMRPGQVKPQFQPKI